MCKECNNTETLPKRKYCRECYNRHSRDREASLRKKNKTTQTYSFCTKCGKNKTPNGNKCCRNCNAKQKRKKNFIYKEEIIIDFDKIFDEFIKINRDYVVKKYHMVLK